MCFPRHINLHVVNVFDQQIKIHYVKRLSKLCKLLGKKFPKTVFLSHRCSTGIEETNFFYLCCLKCGRALNLKDLPSCFLFKPVNNDKIAVGIPILLFWWTINLFWCQMHLCSLFLVV